MLPQGHNIPVGWYITLFITYFFQVLYSGDLISLLSSPNFILKISDLEKI